ncbi:hypothetical protein DL767_008293 [Monosporascus sp. MG133]|nr:hypothetical protein DL767_008293 [Monosporascus sp. MG133]
MPRKVRAHISPYTNGNVFRPRALSPAMSGKSWACTVVMVAIAVTATQFCKSVCRSGLSSCTSKTVSAPQPKQGRATAFIALRCSGPASAPPRSLYSQTSIIKVMLGSTLPIAELRATVKGTKILRSDFASSADILPDGNGRQGLLTESSITDSGSL